MASSPYSVECAAPRDSTCSSSLLVLNREDALGADVSRDVLRRAAGVVDLNPTGAVLRRAAVDLAVNPTGVVAVLRFADTSRAVVATGLGRATNFPAESLVTKSPFRALVPSARLTFLAATVDVVPSGLNTVTLAGGGFVLGGEPVSARGAEGSRLRVLDLRLTRGVGTDARGADVS